MNNKGFTLVELLGCLVLLATILCIGLYSSRGTLATSLSTIDNISENEIINTAKEYIIENNTTWINNEYTCIKISELISMGYLDEQSTTSYNNKIIKITRNPQTKVITNSTIEDKCN